MTLQECVKKEWEATSSNDKFTLQKAGFLVVQEILTQAVMLIQKEQSIDSIKFNTAYASAGTVLLDLLWRIAVRYYNEGRVSSKLNVDPVSFKGLGGKVTINEVKELTVYLREVL